MARVLIAGAGPGGLLLGTLLARTGAEVTVLERQADFAREFRGEILMPSGLEMFDECGLAEPFAAVPQRAIEGVEAWRGSRRLFGIAVPAPGGRLPRAVSQPHLLEMLAAEAGRHAGFRLVRGAVVQGLVEEGGRVAGVRASVGGEEAAFPADLVVGADGRFSVLRERSGLHRVRFPQSFDVVWVKVPGLPALDGPRVRACVGDGHFAVVFPSHDGRLQIGWVIHKGTFGDLRRRGMGEWLAELAGHVPPDLGDHLRARPGEFEHPFLLNVISDRLEEWTRPGLLLIGDAAHPMSPIGGQGLNMALRDAVVAANRIGPLLGPGPADPAALDAAAAAVREERLPETAAIQERQARVADLLFRSPRRARLLLDWLVAPLVRVGVAQRFLAGNLRVFASGTVDVNYRGPGAGR